MMLSSGKMKVVPLGEIADVKSGYAFKSLDYQPNGVKLVRIGNLSDGKLDFGRDTVCIPEEYLKDYDEFALDEGDVLIAMSGATTGKLALISKGDLPCLLNQRVGRFKVVEKEKLFPQFLFYFLSKPSIKKKILELAGGSAQPNVSPSSLKELLIPLLPLIAQQQIAAILEKADAAREKRRRANQLTEQFLQSAFLEMFGDPATNPKGWEIKKVGEVTDSHDSKRIPIEASLRSERKGQFPYYGASGVIDYIDDFIFDFETLLIGEDGANLLARSTPIAFKANGKYWVNNHAHVLTAKDNLTLDYLMFFFNHMSLKPYISGSAQPKLTASNLERIPIPIPPLSEQQKFTALVERVESLRAKQRQSEQGLEHLFHSLMQRAFRGELVRA